MSRASTGHVIRVFEPALCCNTGVCGPDVDGVTFAGGRYPSREELLRYAEAPVDASGSGCCGGVTECC